MIIQRSFAQSAAAALHLHHAANCRCHIFHLFFFVWYTYIGYPVILWLLPRNKRSVQKTSSFNGCTIIIPAYNEATILKQKIENTTSLPCTLPVQIVVITDGSTDGSETIAASFPHITVLHQRERLGKAAAINRAVAEAKYEVLIFTDANTFLNKASLNALIAALNNEEAGAVCGEKRIRYLPQKKYAESFYWKYESVLKKLESKTGSVVGAAGELFAVKKECFEAIPEHSILDDFWLSMRIQEKGFRILYEPNATATELPPQTLKDDLARRTRIAAGVWQWMKAYCSFRQLKKQPFFLWQFLSHRFCRWFIAPVCFLLMVAANTYIIACSNSLFFQLTFIIQAVFLLFAFIGAVPFMRQRFGLFGFPFYFIFTHICLLRGYITCKKHSVLWKKLPRNNNMP